MRSRASFRGHAIHPALIPFPLAFLIGAFLFDVASVVTGNTVLASTARYLTIAGIAAALLAAAPGFIDYFMTVPPASTGKKRATRHMLANLSAVALFAVALFVRDVEPSAAILGLELAGTVLLMMGGWMGGTLVARNQISVDHRYAHAGKWREESVETQAGMPVRVARADELKVNQMKLLHAADKRIVLARTENGYVAFNDRCTHRGASLADGALICGIVQCPWHGSQFDARTGSVKAGPAKDGIATYRVEEREGSVWLTL